VRALVRLLVELRDYRLLWSAGLVSLAGDWVLRVGLMFLVYDLTGSTLATGAMLLSTYLPQLLVGSLAGVLVDRWDRRRTMVATNVAQAFGLLPLLLVNGDNRVWIVYAVALGQGCLAQFFLPAEQAMIPLLVPEERRVQANAVNAQSRDLARLAGSTLGGIAVAWGGITALALLDALTFAASALLIAAIRHRPAAVPARSGDEQHPSGGFSAQWSAGLRLVTADPSLRLLLIFGLITTIGEGIMGTLFAPFVHDVLHGNGTDYGLILGFQSIGGITGGLLVTSYGQRWSPRLLFGWGAVAFGALDLVLFLYPLAWPRVFPALVLMVCIGFPSAAVVAGFMTVLQSVTDDAFRGRVVGTLTTVEAVGILVGIGLASSLGKLIGIVAVIAVQGAGYVVGGLLVLLLLHPAARTAVGEPQRARSTRPSSQTGSPDS
jgi:Na+/melibiose symporter-like transporter